MAENIRKEHFLKQKFLSPYFEVCDILYVYVLSLSHFFIICTSWLVFQSLWSSLLLSHTSLNYIVSIFYSMFPQSLNSVMVLLKGIFNMFQPILQTLEFVCWPSRVKYVSKLSVCSSKSLASCYTLTLDDGRILNSILLVDCFSSNSTHLLWDSNIESY